MTPDPAGRAGAEPAADSTLASPRGRALREVQWKVLAQRYGALAALVALFIYNAIETPFFLSQPRSTGVVGIGGGS